ncbi:MAG: response regulator [candidate division WOR-3 bacterium]|nr:response regulator [candidate division WOR-3 bacterium]
MNIVIVDDNKELTDSIVKYIENYRDELDVKGYYSGEDMLSDIPVIMPDIMFIDVSLPDISGLDLLKEVKDIDEDIQVIIVTAYPTVEHIITALRNGAMDFIKKPVHMKDIISAMEQALGKRKKLMQSRKAVANLIKQKKQHTEALSITSIIDRSMALRKHQELIADSKNEYDIIKTSMDYFENAFGAELAIFLKKREEDLMVFHSNIKDVDYSYYESFIKANFIENIMNKGFASLKKELLLSIEFDDFKWGYLYIKKKEELKKFEIETMRMLIMQLAMKLNKVIILKEIDSKIVGISLAIASLFSDTDPLLAKDCEKLSSLSSKFASYLGLSMEKTEEIRYIALLYNLITHRFISENNPEEMIVKSAEELMSSIQATEMQNSEDNVAYITEEVQFLSKMRTVLAGINENYDGTGKPGKLSGKDIPIESRIIALTSTFLHLVNRKDYRDSVGLDETIEGIEREKGRKFDPEIVEKFIEFTRDSDYKNKIQSSEGII